MINKALIVNIEGMGTIGGYRPSPHAQTEHRRKLCIYLAEKCHATGDPDQIGADRKRREWERRTGYDVKNRAKANAWRARKAAEAIAEQTEQKPVPVSYLLRRALIGIIRSAAGYWLK